MLYPLPGHAGPHQCRTATSARTCAPRCVLCSVLLPARADHDEKGTLPCMTEYCSYAKTRPSSTSSTPACTRFKAIKPILPFTKAVQTPPATPPGVNKRYASKGKLERWANERPSEVIWRWGPHEDEGALEATHGPAVLLLHLGPAEHAADAADAAVADVGAVAGRDLAALGVVEAAVDPRDLRVPRPRELLARGERAQALLARHDDLAVLRHLQRTQPSA